MFGPLFGNFFSSRREFLEEQCSLHITEKIPSSVKFGSRPRIFLIRANSSGVRPCSSTTLGVIAGSAVGIRSIKISETMRPLKSCVSLWQRLQRLCEAFFQARRLTQTFLQQPVAIVPPGPSPRIVRSSRYEFSPNTLRRIPSKYKSRQFVIRLCLGPVAG